MLTTARRLRNQDTLLRCVGRVVEDRRQKTEDNRAEQMDVEVLDGGIVRDGAAEQIREGWVEHDNRDVRREKLKQSS
jgi:hypothetical protein